MAGAPIDVAELFTRFGVQSEVERAGIDNLNTQETAMTDSTGRETTAIRDEAANAAQIQSMVDQIVIDRSARNSQAAADFGVNQEQQNYVGKSIAQAIIAKREALANSGADITARLQRDFVSDPAAWIYDRFSLPYDVAAHNAMEESLNTDAAVLAKLGSLADAQVQRNNAIDASTTSEISAARNKQILAAAEIKVENATQTAIKNNVQIGSVRTQVSQQQYTNFLALQRSIVDLEQLQLSRASLEENKKSRELQRENLNMLIEKRNEDAAARTDLQKVLDQATATTGSRRIMVNEFERMTPQMRTMWENIMINPNIQQGRLGHDTITSLATADKMNFPLTPATQELKSRLTLWTQQIQNQNQAMWSTLKPEQKDNLYNLGIKGQIDKELASTPDTGSIFSPPPIKAMGQIPAVAATTLWKSTFSGLASNPSAPLRSQQVYDTALDLIAGNKMSLEQAASEISTIYKSAVSSNYTDRDYKKFAIEIPEKYRGKYITNLDAGGTNAGWMYSSAKPLDLTSESAVSNSLMRALALRKTRTGVSPLAPTTPAAETP